MSQSPSIIYTRTDEAPALATHAFLRVVRAYADTAGVRIVNSYISLAACVLARIPAVLDDGQKNQHQLADVNL